MQHRDEVILMKIVSEIDIASHALNGVDFDTFDSNEIFKRGICMTVINIGELVKNLSPDFRLTYNQVPWKAIAGFRDIAAHKYNTLNMHDVYETVTNDFGILHKNITDILDISRES